MKAYRARNIEKVKAGQKDHYARNKAKVLEKVKSYAAKNKEKVREAKAKSYDAAKVARRIKIEDWQKRNPEKYKEIRRAATLNRVARKALAPGKYSVKDIRKLYDGQNGKCPICEKSLLEGYHVDHVIPLSKGGDNWPSNLQLLCPACNMAKGAQTMEQFLKRKSP